MEDKIVEKKVVKKVKFVRVKISTPFRFDKKECNDKTKRLPVTVANWMVRKRFGKIL